MTTIPPAIAMFKQECPQTERPLTTLLAQLLADKGIDQDTVRVLASQPPSFVGALFGHLLMRSPTTAQLGSLLQRSLATLSLPSPAYQGTRAENRLVDASIVESALSPGDGLRRLTWRGAAGAYTSGGLRVPARLRLHTRIIIIGAGAAGLLAAQALSLAGFENILLLDQSGEGGGIWRKDCLRLASRANPFPLRFEQCHLAAAPGPGHGVLDFLENIMAFPGQSRLRVVKARVLAMTPGDLAHRVHIENERGELRELLAPIVINAIGAGDPLLPSRPGTMTTDLAPGETGFRWQQVWTAEQACRYHGRSIVLVSLSNSTLEMVKQIQAFNRQGLDVRYTILTHYPHAALSTPRVRVEHQGETFRLYRNPATYELLRMAGDLPEVAAAFEQAREGKHILSHIRHWSRERGLVRQVVAVREDGEVVRIACDELYTLIGYGPRAEILERMGLRVNHPYLGAVDLDYDSEVQREPECSGRARLWPGYFCLGIRNAFNQNEVLLNGLLFRLPDLVAGVVLRATEDIVRRKFL